MEFTFAGIVWNREGREVLEERESRGGTWGIGKSKKEREKHGGDKSGTAVPLFEEKTRIDTLQDI